MASPVPSLSTDLNLQCSLLLSCFSVPTTLARFSMIFLQTFSYNRQKTRQTLNAIERTEDIRNEKYA